jgi:hypothetical protein
MQTSNTIWILVIATAGAIGAYAVGYPVLQLVIAMLLLDAVVIEWTRQKDSKQLFNDIPHQVAAGFDKMEGLCSNILVAVNAIAEKVGVVNPSQEVAQIETTPEKIEAKIETTHLPEQTEIIEAKTEEKTEEQPQITPDMEFSVRYG